MSDTSEVFDAIVIGSGFGGAVTACRLAEADLSVCILERGRRFDASDLPAYPATDGATVPSDVPREGHDAIQPDVSRLFWKLGNGVWDLRDLGDLVVGQAAGLGGGSLIYANVHLRPPEHVFDERWPEPYRREELDPYFDLAARMLQVECLPDEHASLPKRVQLERAARDLNAASGQEETHLRTFQPPLAVNFRRTENDFGAKQQVCDLAGNCCFGCPQQAKNTLDLNYLRRAEERGAVVITLAEAIWIEQLEKQAAAGFRVEYRDHLAGETLKSLYAEHVFLCAGAVNTTELLLRNREAKKLSPSGAALGSSFHPNQDALSVIFDCDEPHELDRGPTITSSLVYDREPDDGDPRARWRLAFTGAGAEPETGCVISCGEDGRARVAAPACRLGGSYEHGDAAGELTVANLRGSFPEGAELTSEEGPCGRLAGGPRKIRHWFLVQDGGMPAALEPALGLFRSPLWLRRNAYREPAPLREDPEASWVGKKGTDPEHAAVSQRIGYAPLPFEALTELASGLTQSAIQPHQALAHEVATQGMQLLRASDSEKPNQEGEPRHQWRLLPDQLYEALQQIRRDTLDDVGLAAEELVGTFLEDAAKEVEPQLEAALSGFQGGKLKDAVKELDLPSRALRLGVQLLWGSQSGLARAVAEGLLATVISERGHLGEAAVALLQRALDYRLGDGRSAVLLSMGLDSTPGRLELELPEEPPAGTELIGVKSGTRAILLQSAVRKGSRLAGDAEGDVIFAAPTGEFQPHEVILAGDRPIGVFEGRRELSAEAQDPSLREMAASLSLAGLSFAPPEAPAAPAGVLAAPLRAHLPAALDTPERGVQERLLRDLASAWSGELRTDPLWTFLRRRITVHSQGGCPMGPPERGSTDDLGQVHGCPGLYVMDAAAFPGPVGANPSATIAAIAEYKVAKFLESRLGTDDARVRALEALREEARQWVDEGRREKLDPLGSSAPAPRSATPAHLPVGIQFEERMVGTTRGEEPLRTIETSLTARIEDLAEFLARHERESTVPIPIVAGTLTLGSRQLQLDPTQSVLRVMVDRGPDETGTERRTLEYTLVAPGCRLEGKKTIRDDQGADVWEDTTTLVFELFENGELSCGGELRLPASEFFGHQVRSFRVNTDDPARQAWALASFGKFFLGHLVDVYLPALDRLGELGASLLDRGHA